ncbi:UPF0280 family protein, partial [bacterium]|nr:UPF0280 family protein [bacterium]
MYEKRFYRDLIKIKDLVTFEVAVKETDLFISVNTKQHPIPSPPRRTSLRGRPASYGAGEMADNKSMRNDTRINTNYRSPITDNSVTTLLREEVSNAILKYRNQIEGYIREDPLFQTSLKPLPADGNAPEIIRTMQEASLKVGVGPFASVAGAIAEFVGRELLKYSKEVIVENGGDIFLKTLRKRRIGIFAGKSKFSNRLALEISPDETPLGVCTSSGTVGHSLSFGRADAVVVVSGSTSLADASATAIGNLIKKKEDIPRGIERAKKIEGLKGVVIIKDDKLGVWGDLRLIRT